MFDGLSVISWTALACPLDFVELRLSASLAPAGDSLQSPVAPAPTE